jgi:hypothetical protein
MQLDAKNTIQRIGFLLMAQIGEVTSAEAYRRRNVVSVGRAAAALFAPIFLRALVGRA